MVKLGPCPGSRQGGREGHVGRGHGRQLLSLHVYPGRGHGRQLLSLHVCPGRDTGDSFFRCTFAQAGT